MNITTNKITAVAGLCAAIAGAIYAGVQINHPPANIEHLVTTEMAVRETAKAVMAVLALAGFAGMFLRNRHRFGVLGVAGYVLAYLDAAVGGSPARDIGGMSVLFAITGAGYALGGLLFGIALFRAGILP